MENTLLVGLSRQMVLERQMDVVANNVANINTNGFKADRSLFEEYLKSGAHEDNFVRSDRRVSFVQDRGTFKDFAAGNTEQTKNPLDVSIDGGGFLAVQTAAGERYTRDGGMQINNQGQLVTAAGNVVLGTSGPIVFQPTDKQINISADGAVTVIEGIRPNVVGNPSPHGGSDSQRAMHAREVVEREMQPRRSFEVLKLFAECVCEARQAAHAHAGAQVHSLHT